MSTVGERIRERRKELGMTQLELAHKMGYKSKAAIAKIEKGDNDISQSNLVKFATVLDTDISYLIGWTEIEERKLQASRRLQRYYVRLQQLTNEELEDVEKYIDFLESKR